MWFVRLLCPTKIEAVFFFFHMSPIFPLFLEINDATALAGCSEWMNWHHCLQKSQSNQTKDKALPLSSGLFCLQVWWDCPSTSLFLRVPLFDLSLFAGRSQFTLQSGQSVSLRTGRSRYKALTGWEGRVTKLCVVTSSSSFCLTRDVRLPPPHQNPSRPPATKHSFIRIKKILTMTYLLVIQIGRLSKIIQML